MGDPFAPPPGDAPGMGTAAGTLGTVSSDLSGDVGKVKAAVGTARSDWRAARETDFASAVFGVQTQLILTMDATQSVAGTLKTFAKALETATTEVADLKAQAARLSTSLQRERAKPTGILTGLELEIQIGALEGRANTVKADLDTLAGQLAASIDAETSKLVPFGAWLSPDQIRRRVDSQMGVSALGGGAPNGGLTTAQAWTLMGVARRQGEQVLDLVEDNRDGEQAGGPVTGLSTNITVLQDLLDAAREDGIVPTRYAGLLAQYWAVRAADKAGIDLDAWDPSKGTNGNRSTISAVYSFYGNLYLNDPKLQWAGMANMIGPSFAGGFLDLDMMKQIAHDLGGPLDDLPGWAKGMLPPPLSELSVISSMSSSEFKWYEDKFLAMQKHIFFDQGSMHEAYTAGGIQSINEMYQAGLIDTKALTAWTDIDNPQHDPQLISQGNLLLLDREQNQIINNQYDQMRNHDGPVGEAVTYLMTAVGSASIPNTRTPGEYKPWTFNLRATLPGPIPFATSESVGVKVQTPLPDFNISNKDSRWDYVLNDTLPAYQALLRDHPDQVRQIVSTPVDQRIDEQRLANRWPQLVGQLTNWDVTPEGNVSVFGVTVGN
jgi:hypothetical protein